MPCWHFTLSLCIKFSHFYLFLLLPFDISSMRFTCLFFQIFAFCSLQGLLGRLAKKERKNVCPPETLISKAKHNECKGANQRWPRYKLLCIVIVGLCVRPSNAHKCSPRYQMLTDACISLSNCFCDLLGQTHC